MKFEITQHKGIHIQFSNGWRASIQFGPGSYSDHFHDGETDYEKPNRSDSWQSSTAEVAAFSPDRPDNLAELYGDQEVLGYLSPDQVLAFLNWVAGDDHDPAQLDLAIQMAGTKGRLQW